MNELLNLSLKNEHKQKKTQLPWKRHSIMSESCHFENKSSLTQLE